MINEIYNYKLDNESIDEISLKVSEFCSTNKCSKKDSMTIRLNVEEALIRWKESGNEGKNISLNLVKNLFTTHFDLSIDTKAENPFEIESEEFGSYGKNLLANIKSTPLYSVKGESAHLKFNVPKKKMGQLQKLLIIVVAAVIVGVLGRLFIPADWLTKIIENLLNPLSDAFYTILGCIAGPMIFLSVAWGIYGIGDSKTFGKVGKRFMLEFILITFIVSAIALVTLPIIGPSFGTTGETESQFGSILNMILSIFPANIAAPFVSGNSLQIIFLGTVVGIALIFLGESTSGVARAIEQINNLVKFIMKFVSELVPYVVFLVFVKLIWADTISQVLSVYQLLLVLLGGFITIMIVFTLIVSIKYKVNPIIVFKKMSPSFLIGLSTASSAAAFSSNMEIAQKKLGVQEDIASFGIPLGMVMSRPSTAMYFMTVILFFTNLSGVTIDFAWLIIMVITVALVSISTPPVSGGAALAYAILFAQSGIPIEYLSVVLAVDIITDFFITAAEVYCLPMSLLLSAGRINKIDLEVLRKK